jgi:hypothetical protein
MLPHGRKNDTPAGHRVPKRSYWLGGALARRGWEMDLSRNHAEDECDYADEGDIRGRGMRTSTIRMSSQSRCGGCMRQG